MQHGAYLATTDITRRMSNIALYGVQKVMRCVLYLTAVLVMNSSAVIMTSVQITHVHVNDMSSYEKHLFTLPLSSEAKYHVSLLKTTAHK